MAKLDGHLPCEDSNRVSGTVVLCDARVNPALSLCVCLMSVRRASRLRCTVSSEFLQ